MPSEEAILRSSVVVSSANERGMVEARKIEQQNLLFNMDCHHRFFFLGDSSARAMISSSRRHPYANTSARALESRCCAAICVRATVGGRTEAVARLLHDVMKHAVELGCVDAESTGQL